MDGQPPCLPSPPFPPPCPALPFPNTKKILFKKAFVHRNALFFVSDFHPGAETLSERFIERQGGPLSEGLVWRLVCQLLGALRAAHAAGAALRNVHPSRVLYCAVGDRVRANWVGCLDVLEYETRKQVCMYVCMLCVCTSVVNI